MLNIRNLFSKKKDETAPPQPVAGDGQGGVIGAVTKLFDKNEKEVARLKPLIERVNAMGDEIRALTDEELKTRSLALRQRFREEVTARLGRSKDPASGEPYGWQELDTELSWSDDYVRIRRDVEREVLDELMPDAFALVREAGDRTIGLRHFDVQLMGGAVLHTGRIAEMKTGEGKTLVATAPVYLNALSGRGVHVITVNDYLAERDANWMRPIYEFLGLTVAFVTNEMENEQRQQSYRADVLYATNSEVGFDYLRDNMARRPEDLVQRPLNFAIVDEVDNILIDEARTPLIISAQVAKTDRALRRQQMAKTCDGLARKLMPAITDREVENLIDSLSGKGGVDIDGLMEEILKRGAFTEATTYLVDAYLVSEKSARMENAARLLDVADEFHESGLLDDAGHAQLSEVALAAVKPAALDAAWHNEMARQVEPFARAWANAAATGWDSGALGMVLAEDLALSDENARAAGQELEGAEDRRQAVALILADEMARRGVVSPETAEAVAATLLEAPAPTVAEEASRPHEAAEVAERRRAEKVVHQVRESVEPLLLELAIVGPGNLQEADVLLQSVVADTTGANGSAPVTVERVRAIIEAMEQVALQALLPFDAMERLWETVRLSQGREALRKEIAAAVRLHPGAAGRQISALVESYSAERTAFLQQAAATLQRQLGGFDGIVARARSGENADQLRRLLQGEVARTGGFAEAAKAVRQFVADQNRAYDDIAEHLAEEMSQWVEVPREARRGVAALLAEGGRADQVRERVLLAVRDLPGENTELPALVGDAVKQLQTWREENAEALLAQVRAALTLPEEAATAIRTAIEDGEYTSGFEAFAGQRLLTAEEVRPLAEAIDAFGAEWDQFKEAQNASLIESIQQALTLSPYAAEAIEDLLGKPLGGTLDAAIFAELAADAVSRHLEPLLTEENAEAFTDEVKRRIPLAKDVQNKLRRDAFTNRSAEQLQRALVRLVERSFQVMPIEDFKRVVKNLAAFTEKDEKRRNAALTDMGTLVAEREAGTPAFTDPENFLDTLVVADILTDEEAAIVRRAHAETPNSTLSAVIDRVLRLPAERRRRVAEAKLQEVQSVLDQSIKAHALFHREVHYVIEAGREIVIVDEFTGRKMPGRRYSEGLHEALEAKHGLEVQLESQTVATITIQNYFRLYNKLAGMTGTAKTEEQEFAKTYGMEVVSIPTNRTVRRADYPDVVYKTAESKFRAITFELLECHCAGQPVLVGTRSVEVSERMSERLRPQPVQALVLAHLVKVKLWDDKTMPDEQKRELMAQLRVPLHQLNLLHVKTLAKQVGLPPDPLHEENVNTLLGLFTVKNPDRNRLTTALRVGLAHNVLNAKNHRNEARIIAEAARPGAVTIATNMAGRGVDILLGGTLDVESRWRVTTLQVLARQLEGKPVHVRSRNQETTNKFVERLEPQRLQDLAWSVGMTRRMDEMERSKELEGQGARELRDALGQEVTTADLKNRIRSRARRLNLLEKLPVDADPLQDEGVLHALNAEFQRLMSSTYSLPTIREALAAGIAWQATGRDMGEMLLLQTLSRPLAHVQQATAKLLQTLTTIGDLDRALLEAAAATGAERAADFDAEQLAQKVGRVTGEWVTARLKTLGVHDAPSARHKLAHLPEHDIEISDWQVLDSLGEDSLGVRWLRDLLRGQKLVKHERAFEVPAPVQEQLGDAASVHYRLDPAAARVLYQQWQTDPARRREMVVLDAPNLMVLGDLASQVGNAGFLNPEWLHYQVVNMGIVSGEGDIMQAQMMGETQDEQGNVQAVPLDILVYRIHLSRLLNSLDPSLREAVAKAGRQPGEVLEQLRHLAPWAADFIDEGWVAQRLQELGDQPSAQNASVFIETGVAGQSTDIVLESEPRPEDIAHTSEQEEVRALGGLHILGTERHESRRIDNQLRGRSGRQGDPGSSRFYVSLEDELWRLFGVRGQWLLNKWDEDEPVEAGMISKSIERAQKKVELNHFESRKHVLQYDDVMNVQREVIYRERRRALLGDDLRDTVLDMLQQAALAEAEKNCPKDVRVEEWDVQKLYLALGRLFGTSLLGRHLTQEDLAELHTREEIDERLREVVAAAYEERERQMGAETLRGLERWQVMRSIDEFWMEHLAEMDYLRDAIWQEGYAQKDPIGVYRQEGFALFQKMLGEIRREVAEAIFAAPAEPQRAQTMVGSYGGPQVLGMQEARVTQTLPMDHGAEDGVQLDKDAGDGFGQEPLIVTRPSRTATGPMAGAMPPATRTSAGSQVATPIGRSAPLAGNGNAPAAAPVGAASGPPGARVGRNDPCPCGSGKKYKKCCLPKEQGVSV